MTRLALALAVIALLASAAHAHKPSDAQLRLAADPDGHLVGRLDVSIRDLDAALGIDTDGNGDLTWAEVHAAEPRIAAYIVARLTITSAGASCAVHPGPATVVELLDGAYSAVPLDVACPMPPAAVEIHYGLLFDLDAQHRGIIHLDDQIVVVRDAATPARMTVGPPLSRTPPVLAGAWGVVIHVEHWLVLLCLLLGRRPEAPTRVGTFIAAQLVVLGLVTAGVLVLPAVVITVAIWASVIAVLVNAATRTFALRWPVALELGALQGFGLAACLSRLGPLPVRGLAAFDLGVVLAELVLAVAVVLGLAWVRRIRA